MFWLEVFQYQPDGFDLAKVVLCVDPTFVEIFVRTPIKVANIADFCDVSVELDSCVACVIVDPRAIVRRAQSVDSKPYSDEEDEAEGREDREGRG